MKIKHAAIRLLKQTGGNITYSTLKRYIYSRECVLVAMNTVGGDALLKHLNVYDRCIGNDGKSIFTQNMNIIVVDDRLSIEDKLRVMLHEIYHIDYHFNNKNNADTTNIQRDGEADAFACEVMKLQKHKILYNRRTQIIVTLLVAALTLVLTIKSRQQNNSIDNNAPATQTQAEISEPQQVVTTDEKVATNVYVMPTGTVYHKLDCRYVVKDRVSEITTAEAEKKGLRPCKVCKP